MSSGLFDSPVRISTTFVVDRIWKMAPFQTDSVSNWHFVNTCEGKKKQNKIVSQDVPMKKKVEEFEVFLFKWCAFPSTPTVGKLGLLTL